jgi:3-oxoacyl-[acyl-carrier protein] reductase
MTERKKFSLEGRTALVTGSGRSIGRAVALILGEAGARVICVYDRDEAAAQSTADEITNAGSKSEIARINIADVPMIKSAIGELAERGIAIDVLVNNAAIRPRTRIPDVTVEEWDEVHHINLRGAFFLSQAVLPHMLQQEWGRIINIGGVDAYRGSIQRPHVVASKLGLVGLARALANETATHGITVNTVVPGLMNTVRYHQEWAGDIEQRRAEGVMTVPMGRLGTAEDVANYCLFLASEEANYITGQDLLVAGGVPLVRQISREY